MIQARTSDSSCATHYNGMYVCMNETLEKCQQIFYRIEIYPFVKWKTLEVRTGVGESLQGVRQVKRR